MFRWRVSSSSPRPSRSPPHPPAGPSRSTPKESKYSGRSTPYSAVGTSPTPAPRRVLQDATSARRPAEAGKSKRNGRRRMQTKVARIRYRAGGIRRANDIVVGGEACSAAKSVGASAEVGPCPRSGQGKVERASTRNEQAQWKPDRRRKAIQAGKHVLESIFFFFFCSG